MDGVTPNMTIGASTEALAGENLIVTAGGIDSHIHFICPQQVNAALCGGITTMIGGVQVQLTVQMLQLVLQVHGIWK